MLIKISCSRHLENFALLPTAFTPRHWPLSHYKARHDSKERKRFSFLLVRISVKIRVRKKKNARHTKKKTRKMLNLNRMNLFSGWGERVKKSTHKIVGMCIFSHSAFWLLLLLCNCRFTGETKRQGRRRRGQHSELRQIPHRTEIPVECAVAVWLGN